MPPSGVQFISLLHPLLLGIAAFVESTFVVVGTDRDRKSGALRAFSNHSKKLIERNLDLISTHWSELREQDNVDKKAESCFAEIARREGRSRLIPSNREALSPAFRPDIPAKWVDFKYIRESLKNRINELRQKRDEQQRLRGKERDRKLCEATERQRKQQDAQERKARERRVVAEREAREHRTAERVARLGSSLSARVARNAVMLMRPGLPVAVFP